jgi:hypothetical protein
MEKAVWAMTSVSIPKGRSIREKTDKNTIPRMISGIMMGSMEAVAIASPSRVFFRCIPTAPIVPMTTAHRHVSPAKMRLLTSASRRSRSRKSSPYHFSENPPHTEEIFDSLKEYTTVSRMGI